MVSQQQREQIKRDLQLLKGDDDQYVLPTLTSMYGLPKLVEYISGGISQTRTDAIGALEARIEEARIDGMFIEWNGLNLCDIDELKASLQQLKADGQKENI